MDVSDESQERAQRWITDHVDYENSHHYLLDSRSLAAEFDAVKEVGRLAGREEIMQIVDADSADHIRRVLAKLRERP
jgi:hypothetical protein